MAEVAASAVDAQRSITKLDYQLDDYPGVVKTTLFGIQHVLVMFTGMIGAPLLLARLISLPPDQTKILVAASMIGCGVGTLISSLGIGFIGPRLPIVMGIFYVFIGPLVAITREASLAPAMSALIIGGAVQLAISPFMGKLHRFFPPVVTGTVLIVIGACLMKIAINTAVGFNTPQFGKPTTLMLATGMIVLVTLISRFSAGMLRALSIFRSERDQYCCRFQHAAIRQAYDVDACDRHDCAGDIDQPIFRGDAQGAVYLHSHRVRLCRFDLVWFGRSQDRIRSLLVRAADIDALWRVRVAWHIWSFCRDRVLSRRRRRDHRAHACGLSNVRRTRNRSTDPRSGGERWRVVGDLGSCRWHGTDVIFAEHWRDHHYGCRQPLRRRRGRRCAHRHGTDTEDRRNYRFAAGTGARWRDDLYLRHDRRSRDRHYRKQHEVEARRPTVCRLDRNRARHHIRAAGRFRCGTGGTPHHRHRRDRDGDSQRGDIKSTPAR